MPITQRLIAVALFVATLFTGAAYAQDKGFYLGVGAGGSKTRQPADCSTPPGIGASSCSIGDTGTGWKLFGGYQLNPSLALELAYVDLGKFKTTIGLTGVLGGSIGDLSATFHPTGYSADVVGTLPLGTGFGVLGRIGVFRWALDASSTGNVSLPGIADPFHEEVTGYNIDFGVGAKWDFTRNLGARVEFQRFPKIGNNDTGKSDVDLLSASLLYRFD